MRTTLLIAVILFCAELSAQTSKHWQRWGGPNANQTTSESDWETDWQKFPPQKAWSADVGIGFSGITLFEDQLFTAGRDGDQDAVYCLNKNTGKEIWRHTYAAPLSNKQHEGGPGTTPTRHKGVVYTLSRTGRVFALNAKDGSVVWDVDTVELTEGEQPWWGFTSSPLVINDKVIFDAGCLLALDRTTGKMIWKTDKHHSGYGSVTQFQNGKRVVVLTNAGLLMVEEESGVKVAETEWITEHPTNATTPIINDDLFFVSTGYKRGCSLFRFADDRFQEKFHSRHLSNHMANSVFHEGHFYGIHGNSHRRRTCTLVCISAEDGEKVWAERGFGCGSVVLAGSHLLILSDQGELTCAPATPSGFTPTAKIQVVEGKCWTAPTFLENRVYCRTAKGDLACWKLVEKDE